MLVFTKLNLIKWASILLISFTPACSANSEFKNIPITKTFALHEANAKTEIYFNVSKAEDYGYQLKFNFTKGYGREVLDILRDYKGNRDGAPVYVSLEVYKLEGTEEYLQTQYGVESLPLYSSGATFNKLIYREYLLPGNYRAILKANRDMPIYKNIKVDFSIGFAHKPK